MNNTEYFVFRLFSVYMPCFTWSSANLSRSALNPSVEFSSGLFNIAWRVSRPRQNPMSPEKPEVAVFPSRA
jgi:hypothetical protein